MTRLRAAWARRGLPAAGIVLLLATLAAFWTELAFLVAPDPRVALVRSAAFDGGRVSGDGRVRAAGVLAGPRGYLLPPGGRGWVEYETAWESPATAWAWLEVSAFGDAPAADGRLRLSVDEGTSYRPVAEGRALVVGRFDVGAALAGRRQVRLRFEGENPTAEPRLLVRKVSLTGYAEAPPPPPPLGRAALLFALVAAAGCLLAPAGWRLLPLAGILGLAFVPRYANLTRVLYAPLDPDAQLYRLFAERMAPFSATGFYSGAFDVREPFFLLVAKGAFLLLGASDTHLRFVSLGASLLAVGLAWRLGRRLLGAGWGWLPALGMAVSVPLIVESGRGLRLEVETVLLLLFADAAFTRPAWPPILRSASAGLAGGLLVLTRSSHLPGLAVLIGLAASRWAVGWRRRAALAAAAVAIMAGLYAPHAVALSRAYGEPFPDQARHARWLANQEFAGQPGFPSREVLSRDAYAGSRLTYLDYLFRLHAPAEVAMGTLGGLGKILTHMDLVGHVDAVEGRLGVRLHWVDWLLAALGPLGMLAALRRQEAWLPVAVVVLTLPIAFPYDRSVFGADQYRLLLHVFPLYLCCLGCLGRSLTTGRPRLGGGDAKEEPHV